MFFFFGVIESTTFLIILEFFADFVAVFFAVTLFVVVALTLVDVFFSVLVVLGATLLTCFTSISELIKVEL